MWGNVSGEILSIKSVSSDLQVTKKKRIQIKWQSFAKNTPQAHRAHQYLGWTPGKLKAETKGRTKLQVRERPSKPATSPFPH